MKGEKLVFNGIYGEDDIKFVRDLINIRPLQSTFIQSGYLIKPHIHNNLFQIFLLEEGDFTLLFNEKSYTIESPSYFTVPKNILHGLKAEKDANGWVISLSDFALERILALDADVFFDIDEINIGKFDLGNPLFENLYTTIYKLIYEYNNELPAKDLALEYLVGMMLIRLFRIPKESKIVLKKLDNFYKIYYRRFKQLIKEDYNFEKPLEAYAATLEISVGHLHRICNEISGKSPRKLINGYLIQEAKIQLANIKWSVADVAFKLGFQDPSYFTRLFRSVEKMTPREYRKKIGLS